MVYIAQQSFGYGEINPNLRNQYTTQPYRLGCMSLENALISETGSAEKRWGSIVDPNYETSTVNNTYEYVSGFGDRFFVYGQASTYIIKGTNHTAQTFSGKILNVASRGPDLIVLTDKGIFRHEFNKSGSNYSSIRYNVELQNELISSTPPVTLATNDVTGEVTLTSNSSWFRAGEDEHLYRLCSESTVNTVTSPSRISSGLWLELKPNGFISTTQYTANVIGGSATSAQIGNTLDWTGPYTNWKPVGNTLFNTTTSASGVTESATWDLTFLATGNKGLNVTPDGRTAGTAVISTDFDSNHVSAMHVGKVGKFVEQVVISASEIRTLTYYFVVVWGPGVDRDYTGTDADKIVPLIYYYQSDASEQTGIARTSGTPNSNATLTMYLASSDGINADGLPEAKFGFYPSVLARLKTPRYNGNSLLGQSTPVELVGSPSSTTTVSSTTVSLLGNGSIVPSTSDTIVRKNVTVGPPEPTILSIPVNDTTMRVSKWEIEEWNGRSGTASFAGNEYVNNYHRIDTSNGPGPSSYWNLQASALTKSNGLEPQQGLISANELEIHQERTFVGGFESNAATIDAIPEAQDLPLTVMASKAGELTNFSTGANAGDGFSFIISSKNSGIVCWMKSLFNQLFIGTTEEEYVVTDIPIQPDSINVQRQSSYGSARNIEAVIFNQDILFVGKDGKTIRSLTFRDSRKRYESVDMLRFAKHLTKLDTISRIERVKSSFERLFVTTVSGKLHCFSALDENGVYGWNTWANSNFTYNDILATTDDSGNPALWARVTMTTGSGTASKAVLMTSDTNYTNRRMDLITEHTGSDIQNVVVHGVINVSDDLLGKTVSYIVVTNGVEAYYGEATVRAITGSSATGIYFGDQLPLGEALATTPTKVFIGLPYTFSLVPHIPEVDIPGKGSTSGRNKNISRVRLYFNAARGGVVEGNSILKADNGLNLVQDSPGFYSVAVIGEYGPQPAITISQSVPYEFEVSGFNAEYDYGD